MGTDRYDGSRVQISKDVPSGLDAAEFGILLTDTVEMALVETLG